MARQTKKEQADRLIQYYWARGVEHGPVCYEEYGKLMGTTPYSEVQEMFAARYPSMADELVFAVYG